MAGGMMTVAAIVGPSFTEEEARRYAVAVAERNRKLTVSPPRRWQIVAMMEARGWRLEERARYNPDTDSFERDWVHPDFDHTFPDSEIEAFFEGADQWVK